MQEKNPRFRESGDSDDDEEDYRKRRSYHQLFVCTDNCININYGWPKRIRKHELSEMPMNYCRVVSFQIEKSSILYFKLGLKL